MKRRVLAALLGLGMIGPASAFAVPDGGVELIDRPSGFGPLPFDGINEASVDRHALGGASGCRVAIESNNDVLSALDDDSQGDIFVIDRCAPGHPATLASATAAGVAADGDSFSPSISADGNKVAFTTTARNLLPPGTTVRHAIVVKDLVTGGVTVASRSNGAGGAVAEAFQGVISGDGNAVAFRGDGAIEGSNATGVADGEDVYVRYLVAGETRMASVTKTFDERGGADGDFDISYDGLEVALITESALDPTADTDGERSAYRISTLIATPTVEHVSGTVVPRAVAISGDATRVAFADDRLWMTTCAPSCGAPDPMDSTTPPGGSVSIYGVGFPAGAGAPPTLFWSTNRALTLADTNAEDDFYIRDLTTNALSLLVPHRAGGVGAGDHFTNQVAVFNAADPALPGTDGVRAQVFAYDDGGNTALLSLPDGETRRGETYNTSVDRRHAVAESGRFVVMETQSPGLGAPVPAPGRFWLTQAIVRDVAGGTTTLASSAMGGGPSDRYIDNPSIDALGARVAFESAATNLVPDPTAGNASHVYVRDLATGTTQRVDKATGGAHDAVLSGDGTKVVFISNSPDLPDANTFDHAYLADLATGSVALVDRAADGAVADNDAREVDVSADGSRVAFISYAKNLGGFATAEPRVFVKDVASGALTFASAPESGTPSVFARQLSLSGAGSRVAWVEDDPGFGYGSDGVDHIFMRDLVTGTTTLASAGGPTAPGAEESEGELDRTGTHLAFLRRFPDAPGRPLLRDLTSGTTTELLPGRRSPGFGLSVSPDGHCVAVNSNSPDVLPTGNPSPDFDHVYLLGVGADCPPIPPGGGPGGSTDTTRPVISRLRMLRKRFAVAKKRTALSARRRTKRGSAFLFTLSEDARTSIAIARALPGRRSGKRCVKPRKNLRRRCTRYKTLATLTRTKTKQGANRIAFSGRLGSRKLKPGRYRATVGAVDAAGNRAARKRVTFRVVRR